jgi:riboflavin synthase
MFTGLIEDIGTVERIDAGDAGVRMRIRTLLADELSSGDSIAVNGACLTAVAANGDAFEADVVNQTLELTSLGPLRPGERVNLELPMRLGDRLGGHLVQGHVDGIGAVVGSTEDGFGRRLVISVPEDLRRYLVARGSVTVDGVSLTIAGVSDGSFEVALIPETLERTTLGEAGEGRRVNLELDVIARYVERLVSRLGEKGTE